MLNNFALLASNDGGYQREPDAIFGMEFRMRRLG